ncbi:hypothetical protein D3C76_1756910 [compost metagenome]
MVPQLSAFAGQADSLQSGLASGVQLLHHIGEEEDLLGGQADGRSDALVGRCLALGPGRGVEVAGEQRTQVAGLGAAEDQLLRLDRA